MFAKRLVSLLDVRGVSQKRVSYTSGISESDLSKIIANTRTPRYDQIVSISKALSVEPYYFFERQREKSPRAGFFFPAFSLEVDINYASLSYCLYSNENHSIDLNAFSGVKVACMMYLSQGIVTVVSSNKTIRLIPDEYIVLESKSFSDIDHVEFSKGSQTKITIMGEFLKFHNILTKIAHLTSISL